MTHDEFYDSYDLMLEAAYDGYAVCIVPLEEGAKEKLGVVMLPVSPAAQDAAEHLEDDDLLELTATLIVKAKGIADRMSAAGIDSYDGPEI